MRNTTQPIGLTLADITQLVINQPIETVLENIKNGMYTFKQALTAYAEYGMISESMSVLQDHFSQLTPEELKHFSELAEKNNHTALRQFYLFLSMEPSGSLEKADVLAMLFAAADMNHSTLVSAILEKAPRKNLLPSMDELIGLAELMIFEDKPAMLGAFLTAIEKNTDLIRLFFLADQKNNEACMTLLINKLSKDSAITLIQDHSEALSDTLIQQLKEKFELTEEIKSKAKQEDFLDMKMTAIRTGGHSKINFPDAFAKNDLIGISLLIKETPEKVLDEQCAPFFKYQSRLLEQLILHFKSALKNEHAMPLSHLVGSLGLVSIVLGTILRNEDTKALDGFMWQFLPTAQKNQLQATAVESIHLFNALDKAIQDQLKHQSLFVAAVKNKNQEGFLGKFNLRQAVIKQDMSEQTDSNLMSLLKIHGVGENILRFLDNDSRAHLSRTCKIAYYLLASFNPNQSISSANIQAMMDIYNKNLAIQKRHQDQFGPRLLKHRILIGAGTIPAGVGLFALVMLLFSSYVFQIIRDPAYGHRPLSGPEIAVALAVVLGIIPLIILATSCFVAPFAKDAVRCLKKAEPYELTAADRENIEIVIRAFTPNFLTQHPHATDKELMEQMEKIVSLVKSKEALNPNKVVVQEVTNSGLFAHTHGMLSEAEDNPSALEMGSHTTESTPLLPVENKQPTYGYGLNS